VERARACIERGRAGGRLELTVRLAARGVVGPDAARLLAPFLADELANAAVDAGAGGGCVAVTVCAEGAQLRDAGALALLAALEGACRTRMVLPCNII
jgi:hypothetical protein